VAAAVSNAMQSAQLERADEVKFVQVKCPLLRDEDIASTIKNGTPVVTSDPYESMAFSRGASALGSALALREISSLLDSDICVNWDLFSAVTSVSSGSELRHCEVLVFGNSCQVPGDLSVDSFLMQDTIDASGFLSHCNGIDYFTNHDDIRQVFAKADPVGMIRGKRTVMLNDSDIQSTRHARAAVGGLLAAFVGRTDIYVSGGAEHQGPRGGGPVAVISAKSRTQLGDCSNG
jgi:cyanuric acid amidohydrolase